MNMSPNIYLTPNLIDWNAGDRLSERILRQVWLCLILGVTWVYDMGSVVSYKQGEPNLVRITNYIHFTGPSD